MRRLLLITAFAAIAAAKPGTYRETEDFQYSRSSSDEGHKAGYYGAQRGNTGGNFEKAHNMDSLAQNQMSSAVNHVQGEIGDTADAPVGNVFTSANTKGTYGRGGHYDLTNLHGRNFQEGVSVDDSRSHSSLSSLNSGYGSQSSLQNSGYTGGYSSSNTKTSGYSGLHTSGQYYQAADQRAAAANDNAYTDLFDRQTGQRSAYNQQAGYGGYNRYEQRQNSQHAAQSNYGSDSHTRLVGAGSAPVRVVIRPGSTINVPVAAEAYDSRHTASAFDQNSINSEAEVLTNANNQQITGYKPTNQGKSYESSYSYNKKWEKHDTVPVATPLAIPTVNPYPVNSELYGDYESNRYHGSAATAQNQLSQNYLGYNTAASNSQHQSSYNTHLTKSSAAGANANTYNSAFKNDGSSADLASLVSGTNADGTPKKYESSYSYRKSWERQGDPYVIKLATGPVYHGQASQGLRAGSAASHSEYRSNKHASHSGYSQSALEEDCDCDEQGHVRVARSYGSEVSTDQQSQKFQDDGQIVQNSMNLEDLGQQTQQNQFENLEDLTQQTQQNQFDNLEDLGQQTQNKWDLEDLTQQTQENNFDKYHVSSQQTQRKPLDKLEDLGQQTQENQFGKLEDLGQQAQSKWEQEDLGQQTQNFDKYYQTRHGPQRQGNLDKLNPASQHNQASMQSLNQGIQTSQGESTHKDSFQLQGNNEKPIEIEQTVSQGTQSDQIEDLGQQTEYGWDKLEILNQHKPKYPQQDDLVKPVWEQPEDDTQQTVSQGTQSDKIEHGGQQTEYGWDKLEILNQHKPRYPQQDDLVNGGQQTEYGWDKLEISNQHKPKYQQQDDLVKPFWKQSEDETQQASVWQNNQEGLDQQSHDGTGHGWNVYEFANTQENQNWLNQQMGGSNLHSYHNLNSNSHHGSSLQSLWDKIDNLAEQSATSENSNENQNTNGDRNQFLHGYGSHNYNSQHSYQTWDQRNSENSQSSHHQNSFGSSYAGSNPWQFNHGGQNKDTSQETENSFGSVNSESHTWQWNAANKNFTEISTTEKSRHGSGSTYTGRRPWQWTPVIEETQTTEKPKDSNKSGYGDRGDIGGDDKNDDDVNPSYPGRGDIGTNGNGATTDKPKTTIYYSPENSNFNRKPFRTPEEIETLSLTKESEDNKTENVNKNTNLNANSQSDAGLSVMSINEQWLNEQKRHESNRHLGSTTTSTSTPTTNTIAQNNYHQSQTINQQRESVATSDQGFTSNNYRKPYGHSITSQNDKDLKINEQVDVLDQSQRGIEEQNTDQQFVDFSNLEQQNTDKHFGYGQESPDLVQQSQTAWGEDLKDLGQKVQTGWNGNENSEQQSDLTQQTGSFDTFGQPHIQRDNFYEQKYQSANYQSPQTAPVETPKKSNDEMVVRAIVEEVTTPKPGFWKSVGNKFVGAKDKVSSWFSSSS